MSTEGPTSRLPELHIYRSGMLKYPLLQASINPVNLLDLTCLPSRGKAHTLVNVFIWMIVEISIDESQNKLILSLFVTSPALIPFILLCLQRKRPTLSDSLPLNLVITSLKLLYMLQHTTASVEDEVLGGRVVLFVRRLPTLLRARVPLEDRS